MSRSFSFGVLARCLLGIGLLAIGVPAVGAERRPPVDIPSDLLMKETQLTVNADSHFLLVWWVPQEFWENALAKDKNTPAIIKRQLLDTLSKVSVVGVVQADITPLGGFNFYSKEEVTANISSTLEGAGAKVKTLEIAEPEDPDLKVVIGQITPMLSAAMGQLGKNFHFFVINDEGEKGARVIDPYRSGSLKFQAKTRDKVTHTMTISLPLDSLHVPRKCPNGKDAHISWKFCPWTGKPLPE